MTNNYWQKVKIMTKSRDFLCYFLLWPSVQRNYHLYTIMDSFTSCHRFCFMSRVGLFIKVRWFTLQIMNRMKSFWWSHAAFDLITTENNRDDQNNMWINKYNRQQIHYSKENCFTFEWDSLSLSKMLKWLQICDQVSCSWGTKKKML